MTSCDHLNELHDYALDELTGPARTAFEQHVTSCAECASELEALRLTTAALRTLPDREIPQRIAFVSDRIFEPSPWSRFFNGGLGFASACVLAGAIIISAWHMSAAGPANKELAQQVDRAVTKAVKAADERHAKEYRELMVEMDENMSVLQKKMNTSMLFAASDAVRYGSNRQ